MQQQKQQQPQPLTQQQPKISTTTEVVSKSNRFTDPIPSFAGKIPTPREKEIIKSLVSFFKEK
jgi:hypothetical protein